MTAIANAETANQQGGANDGGLKVADRMNALKNMAQEKFQEAREIVTEKGKVAIDKATHTTLADMKHSADVLVQGNPMRSVAIALGVGVLVGALLMRRRG